MKYLHRRRINPRKLTEDQKALRTMMHFKEARAGAMASAGAKLLEESYDKADVLAAQSFIRGDVIPAWEQYERAEEVYYASLDTKETKKKEPTQ